MTAPQWLRRWREMVAMSFGFAYFGLGGLVITLLGIGAHIVAPQTYRAGRRVIGSAFRSFLRVLRRTGVGTFDLQELDQLKNEPGIIIAPNHPTVLDAVLVLARVPDAVCILKAPLLGSPFLGGGARWANYIRNDSGAVMVRQATAELTSGGKLLVFPEGTRTHFADGPLNPFKGGFALIARAAAAPVQTVLLEIEPPYLGKSVPWWKFPRCPIRFRARLGRRFDPPGPAEDPKIWVRRLEDYFRDERAGAESLLVRQDSIQG